MLPIITVGIIIAILYFLLIKGYLWKLLFLIFGYLGMYWSLVNFVPSSKAVLLIVLGHGFSWAICIPTILVFLLLATSKVEKNEI